MDVVPPSSDRVWDARAAILTRERLERESAAATIAAQHADGELIRLHSGRYALTRKDSSKTGIYGRSRRCTRGDRHPLRRSRTRRRRCSGDCPSFGTFLKPYTSATRATTVSCGMPGA